MFQSRGSTYPTATGTFYNPAMAKHSARGSLQWYVLKQVSIATFFILFALTATLWLIRSIEFIDLVINRGMSGGTLLYLTWLLLPSFLLILLPVSLCTAVLFTYNRLITESELVVMRAAGLSAFQLARPALIAATAATAICYSITLYFLPASQRAFNDIQTSFLRDFASILLREGVFNVVAPGMVVYVRSRDRNGELQGLIFHDSRDRKQPVTIMAERGALVEGDDGPRVLMFNGNRQQVDPANGKLSLLYFDRFSVDLLRAQNVRSNNVRTAPQRFLFELLEDKPVSVRMLSEFHSRLVSPLLNMTFTLISLAALLWGNFNRRGQNLRIGIAAVAITVSQILTTVGLESAIQWSTLFQPACYIPTLVASTISLLLLGHTPRPKRAPPGLAMAAQA